MLQALYSGVSGIQNTQFGIDTVSNNVANVNTVGFKSSRAEFSSLYSGALKDACSADTQEKEDGVGVQRSASIDFNEGIVQKSDRNTDLAIAGNGWFAIKNSSGLSFTRAGNFAFDANRNLVQPDGSFLMGTLANNIQNNTITKELHSVDLTDENSQVPLSFPTTLNYPAKATSKVDFFANIGLDKNRTIGATVIDKDGNKNALKLTFTKDKTQPKFGSAWSVNATLTSADGKTVLDTQDAKAIFDTTGNISSNTLRAMHNNGSNFTINLGDGSGQGVRAFADDFVASRSQSDGVETGALVGYKINKDGDIIANFSNAKTSAVGKIAIYHFRNNQGLEAISGTHYKQSDNSGPAHFWKDSDGRYILGSSVMTESLEGSNVTLEKALTELIILQRSFSANTKSITTSDQMIQKALNMKK